MPEKPINNRFYTIEYWREKQWWSHFHRCFFCRSFVPGGHAAREFRAGKEGADGIRRSGYERVHCGLRETVLPLVRRPGHPEPRGTQEEVLLGQVPLGVLEI